MNKKIECLSRYEFLTLNASPIREFLIEERLARPEEYTGAVTKLMEAEVNFIALKHSISSEKAMLVDYEWTILPHEQIRITIVTPDTKKEFSFGI